MHAMRRRKGTFLPGCFRSVDEDGHHDRGSTDLGDHHPVQPVVHALNEPVEPLLEPVEPVVNPLETLVDSVESFVDLGSRGEVFHQRLGVLDPRQGYQDIVQLAPGRLRGLHTTT